jgi:hypothetical protein
MHVPLGVNLNHKAYRSDHYQHHCGKGVHQNAQMDVEVRLDDHPAHVGYLQPMPRGSHYFPQGPKGEEEGEPEGADGDIATELGLLTEEGPDNKGDDNKRENGQQKN